MKIEKIKQDVRLIHFPDGKQIYLIGTAHVSLKSAELVEEIILEVKPDGIGIELDSQRFEVIKNKSNFESLDIVKILRKGQGFFFIGHLLLSSFQKKLSDKTGTQPGLEFKKAIELAEEKNIKIY